MPPTPRRPVAAAAAAVSRPAVRGRAPVPTATSGYHGEEGRRRMLEEQERQEARKEAQASMSGMPFRFFCPVGETREVIVVDDAPNFFRHEHNLKDSSGRWSIFTSCIEDRANCPVCASNPDKQAYFAMYLTVIDLTPYVNKDNIEVPWSKKLMVVKSTQQKKIMRLYERTGNLRGMILSMTRDGDKDAAIGNDIEFAGEVLDEDALAEYVNVYMNKENKEITIDGSVVFDYDALFPEQTEEMLASIVGGHVNNRESHDRNIGRTSARRPGTSGDDWQGAAPARGAARPAARQAAPARPAARPAPVRGRAPVEEAEPEEVYEEEAEAAPARPAARPAPRQAAAPARPSAVRGRPAPAEPEDEPQRPATSLADRRRALRR